MLKLSVNARSPAAITAALKKIREMITAGAVDKTTPVHLVLEPGTYRESVRYNLSNPLVMEGIPGSRGTDCVLQAENCEAFHAGAENRAVLSIGPNATNVKLRNFTVINTHQKTVLDGSTAADAAEALTWSNAAGTLLAEGMRFEGRQNVLCVRGFCWFKDCFVSGDTDVVYGRADTVLFEETEIFVREDNRGDFPGFAVKSLAPADRPGIVFLNCRFTAAPRKKSPVYVYRTDGTGGPATADRWDNAAFINCFVSKAFSEEFAWDDDMSLTIHPRGTSTTGIREYNTRVVDFSGRVEEADTTRRNIRTYALTDADYDRLYASRYLILRGTPFATENEQEDAV